MGTIVKTNRLTKKYGDTTVLDNLSLTVEKGEVLGYLGPNGAGKTTTIRLLLGLIRPTSGSATLFGEDAWRNAATIHQHVAYVPGETNLWPSLSGAETLRFLANLHGSTDQSYQDELIQKFNFDPNKKVRAYSKGNRQKIALIAALASRADLLVFDEPTSGLDPVMAKLFRDEVRAAKQNGQTIFLSSHIMEEVEELCDRVGVLRAGKLIEIGTLDEMRHLSAMTIEATFADTPPNLKGVRNVSHVEIQGNFLRCNVNGSMDALLTALAKAKPVSLTSRKPSLEELFLSLYANGGTNGKK